MRGLTPMIIGVETPAPRKSIAKFMQVTGSPATLTPLLTIARKSSHELPQTRHAVDGHYDDLAGAVRGFLSLVL